MLLIQELLRQLDAEIHSQVTELIRLNRLSLLIRHGANLHKDLRRLLHSVHQAEGKITDLSGDLKASKDAMKAAESAADDLDQSLGSAGKAAKERKRMIRKRVRQMLTAQVFSALTVSLCLLIDSIMIGRFLGEQAIAAYGLANPLLLAIGAIGSLLAAGIQVTCSRSLGRGSQEETNAGYSSAIMVAGIISGVFMVAAILFRSFFAKAMGAGSSGELFNQTRDYIAGFSIGAPGSMGALTLVPFLQMAGQSNLLIVAVASMTVADVALDLLNVLVFHGGMFGIGLASSLSYYVAMVFAAVYFLSKKCIFRFSLKKVTKAKIIELLKGGVPAGVNMAASVLLVFALNRILLSTGGAEGVAAYAVIMSIGNAANCITTGIGGVSLTLCGILYNEEDRTGLKDTLTLLVRYAVILGAVGGDAGLGMEVLSPVTQDAIEKTRRMREAHACTVEYLDSEIPLHFTVEVSDGVNVLVPMLR